MLAITRRCLRQFVKAPSADVVKLQRTPTSHARTTAFVKGAKSDDFAGNPRRHGALSAAIDEEAYVEWFKETHGVSDEVFAKQGAPTVAPNHKQYDTTLLMDDLRECDPDTNRAEIEEEAVAWTALAARR